MNALSPCTGELFPRSAGNYEDIIPATGPPMGGIAKAMAAQWG